MLAPDVTAGDAWLAIDKLEHFVACGLCTLVAYGLCRRHYRAYRGRFTLSIFAGIIVGVLKELGDYLQFWAGGLSAKDLTADAAGSLVVAAVLWALERRYGVPTPPPPPYPYTSCWASVRAVLCGVRSEPRVVDLEHGLVYGQRILRQYGNSLKDLRSLIPNSSSLARWGGFDTYGYKPLVPPSGRGAGGGGGGGASGGAGSSAGGSGLDSSSGKGGEVMGISSPPLSRPAAASGNGGSG